MEWFNERRTGKKRPQVRAVLCRTKHLQQPWKRCVEICTGSLRTANPKSLPNVKIVWAQLRAIETFKNELTKMIDNGKVAQRAIERASKNLV
jgi:acetolactate synthase regulatory subunit